MARGAILSRSPLGAKVYIYGQAHLRTLLVSLGRIWHAPLSSIMTTAVIGIALALPCGLYVLLANLQSIAGGWDNTASISLFLKIDTPPATARDVAAKIDQRGDVKNVRLISAAEAMAEFQESSGFGDALDKLERNPLPPVLVVTPAAGARRALPANALLAALRTLPDVDLAQLDMEWLQRLQAIMDIARRGVTSIAILLGLAVLLIVGNTIRLEIHNRREEIEVTKLVGATDGYVRRPFLYGGVWYGLLGGVLAWLLVGGALLLIDGPAAHLALLYRADHQLIGPGIKGTLLLLGTGAALGLLGSWLAVGRHLSAIEPR
ncbi:MAG: ABC transporter permease [Gammaproteobacteria bacterium]|nr:ABC transporter permease [Gammaproteobacteria bacterium]